MFVYNKGKLEKSVFRNPQDNFVFRLFHVSTGMIIEVELNVDKKMNLNPYKVFREVDGSYTIYEEFFKKNKTQIENFEEAISFFEDNIYKILGEIPPSPITPYPKQDKPPETFQEVPIVGDIIQVENKYGVVTDINDTQVVTKELSKDEAMKILRNQKNAQLSIAQSVNTNDVSEFELPSFDDGGNLSSTVVFDTKKNKIIILRVKQTPTGEPPPPPPTDDENPPPPPEPQPDNIIDPFDETPPPPINDEKDNEEKDDEEKDNDEKDNEEKDDEEKDNEEKDDDEKDDDEKDDDEKDDDDEPELEEEKPDGEGTDGEFGNEDDMQSLEEMLKKIKDDFDSGKSQKDFQYELDSDILAKALSVPFKQIKNTFGTKSIVLSAIGRRNIFGTDNEQRLNQILNQIFT